MTDLNSSLPSANNSNNDPLAPLFTVIAVKTYKPNQELIEKDTLLPFKRKQIITVLDWDEKRDAIFGELDEKRGWFPSSYAKIISTNTGAPSKISDISPAAAQRNAIPVGKGNSNPPKRIIQQSASNQRDASPSPRRNINGLLSASISIIPNIISSETTSSYVTSLKSIKLLNSFGVPLILVNIIEYCRSSEIIDSKDLFKTVGNEKLAKEVLESFCKENVSVDLAKFSDKAIISCLKTFLLSLSEPLLTYDLFDSFTAAADIEDNERKTTQFFYLLELIPQQNYNVASYLTYFLNDCTLRCNVNNFTLDNACRMFSSVFCRAHSLTSIDETDIKKSSNVIDFLIKNCEILFKECIKINKKLDKNREQRRKKEKEMMQSYNRNQTKKVKKEEKRQERIRKKQKPLISSDSSNRLDIPSPKTHIRSASTENVESPKQPRLVRSTSSTMKKIPQKPQIQISPERSKKYSPRSPQITQKSIKEKENKNIPQPKSLNVPQQQIPHNPKPKQKPTKVNQNNELAMAKFYKIGFYTMLVIFVISHLLRSIF